MQRPPVVRMALIQPQSFWGPNEEKNVQGALEWLDRCSKAGAQLVVFPEGYPGPTNPKNSYDALNPLRERAAEFKLHVIAANIESSWERLPLRFPASDWPRRKNDWQLPTNNAAGSLCLSRYSDVAVRLQRIVEQTGRVRDQNRTHRMLVCSEVYSPELSRALAVQGADIIVYPAGGGQGDLIPTWQTVVAARAIENIVYTGASQNLYEPHERGLGIVAGPEGILATRADAGILITDLDLDRLEFLRGEDEKIEVPRRYRTVPGLLRWRRPELYSQHFLEPRESRTPGKTTV